MDGLEAVGDPQLRATFLWVSARQQPVTADDLATTHDLHRNVARTRLERLTDAGLLRATFERRTGRRGPGAGRPAKLYEVAPRVTPIEFPARRYDVLVALLLEALPAGTRAERLRGIGAEFGRDMARAAGLRPVRSVEKALPRICAALGRLGYQITPIEATSEHAVLATPSCPLRPLLHVHPKAVELDRGMWSGVASFAVTGLEAADVSCSTRSCLDANTPCSISLALRPARF